MIIAKSIKELKNEKNNRTQYVMDYTVYLKLSTTRYIIEDRGSIKTDFYFDANLARKNMLIKWNSLKKELYIQKESDMDPRRFEMVYTCEEIK